MLHTISHCVREHEKAHADSLLNGVRHKPLCKLIQRLMLTLEWTDLLCVHYLYYECSPLITNAYIKVKYEMILLFFSSALLPSTKSVFCHGRYCTSHGSTAANMAFQPSAVSPSNAYVTMPPPSLNVPFVEVPILSALPSSSPVPVQAFQLFLLLSQIPQEN